MRLLPNSWGSPKRLREYNKCHDAKGKFCSTGGLSDDEGSDTAPPEIGQPFIVYRLWSGPTGLDNKNAGIAVGVAEHLANIEDPEKPAMLGGYGDTISAYIVRVRRPFTSYSGFKNKSHTFDYGVSKPEGNAVGRVVIGGAVVNYAFPKGGEWTATHLASIPLKDIKKKLSYPSFDYVGTASGGTRHPEGVCAVHPESPAQEDAQVPGVQPLPQTLRPGRWAVRGQGAMRS